MRKRAAIALAAAFVGAASLVTPTYGMPVSGTGEPVSVPALAGGTIVDFDSLPTGLFASVGASGVTFTGVGAPLDIGSDFIGAFNTRGTQSLYNNFDLAPHTIEIAFDNPVSAFAFNWGASDNIWDMTAFDSADNILETSAIDPVFSSNAGDFFGIATAGIARILLVDRLDTIPNGDYVFVDNFTFAGNVSPVPLPGAVWLMLSSIAALAAACRANATKRKSNAA